MYLGLNKAPQKTRKRKWVTLSLVWRVAILNGPSSLSCLRPVPSSSALLLNGAAPLSPGLHLTMAVTTAFPHTMRAWTHSPAIPVRTSTVVCLTDRWSPCPSHQAAWVICMRMKHVAVSPRAVLASLLCHKCCHLPMLTIVTDEQAHWSPFPKAHCLHTTWIRAICVL